MADSRLRKTVRWIVRGAVAVLVIGLLAGVAGAMFLESSWGKDRIRRLVVSQANRFLTGTIEIDRVDGSILRGIRLEGIRLVQDGVPVVTVADASLEYGIRELYDQGTVIRRLVLHRLRVVGARGADGRWNLGALVRPRPPRAPGRPARLIAIQRLELIDATVEFRDPLAFGAVHVPARLDDLQATMALELRAPDWSVDLAGASWRGSAPDLRVTQLAGGIGTDAEGWTFRTLRVETPRSAFTVAGRLARGAAATTLALDVTADRLAFQEWGGVVTGLRNIAVESAFTVSLAGPLTSLATTLDLRSTGGAIRGQFVLDSSVPGWHGAGTADVDKVDLARWLNRPERPSSLTGRATFDLDLDLGLHFPRGPFTFAGPHVEYLGYAADHIAARGHLTRDEAVLASVTATAYGANIRVDAGAVGIDAPYRYRFAGRADGVDLRRLPRNVPVPHVESTLVLDYDARGSFGAGVITGRATFGPSDFLGARIAEGAVGAVDTSVTPFTYSGDGVLAGVSVRRFGEGLDIAWMRDPRYDGVLAGRFHAEGAGSDTDTMRLSGGGRLTRAEIFQGSLSDADVEIQIADGSLTAAYDGRFDHVNPATAIGDDRFGASLAGAGRLRVAVRDLMRRTTTLADYALEGAATLGASRVRDIEVRGADAEFGLADQVLTFRRFAMTGPAIDGHASGTLALDGARASRLDYDITRADLALAATLGGPALSGTLSTAGQLTGTSTAPRVTGTARLSRLNAGTLEALTGRADYEATVPVDEPRQGVGRLSGTLGPLTLGTQAINELTLSAAYDRGRLTADLRGTRAGGINAALSAELELHPTARTADVASAILTVQGLPWRLVAGHTPRLAWDAGRVTIEDLALADADSGRQGLAVSGDWSRDGGALHVVATGVFLDPFLAAGGQPARYGGRLDADVVVRQAAGAPLIVTGQLAIAEGRIRQMPFERLTARVDFREGLFDVDARLDQAPGVWLTAAGTVPLGLLVAGQPELPMKLAVVSSPIDLTVLEGVTDVVREVTGRMQLNLAAAGTSADPHVEGTIEVTGGAFVVQATGVRYRNARLAASLTRDRFTVETLHVEDGRSRALDVSGSLGTHELRVGDFEIDARARQFEVVRNAFGRTDVDADLKLRGRFESPRLTGSIAITGGELNVDEILDRTLLQPYATEAAPGATAAAADLDALVALNPWDRLGLDLSVSTRGTLRMVGENVQVASGTPLGLGNVNLRAFGDIYLYKDPARPLFITGSLDSLIGTYAFQGRRFDLDPVSSIVFRGDLNPELYVTVTRTISGVETRVSIVGPLSEPELRLASVPSLDDSDILSLIVFNTQANQLSAGQQQELAIRAGTLAAGFLTTPLLGALERSLGLDILEIEPDAGGRIGGSVAPRVTVGDEIAPGLVARFSRQFGAQDQQYNEATIEYFLSRLFRIRATFSDASALTRSQFRRSERAGIDLLIFLSF